MFTMEEIANKLGLGLYDEFTIRGMDNFTFRFTKSNLKVEKEGSGSINDVGDYILGGLIRGSYSIDKVIKQDVIHVYQNYSKFTLLCRREKCEDRKNLDMLVSKITSALKNGEYMNIVINKDNKSKHGIKQEEF